MVLSPDKKKLFLIFAILILGSACSSKILSEATLKDRSFESDQSHVYGGRNRLTFKPDNTFIYSGAGPSLFLSKGHWRYDPVRKEIGLKTDNSLKPQITDPLDTMWVDLTSKNIKVISKKKIVFENIIYYDR